VSFRLDGNVHFEPLVVCWSKKLLLECICVVITMIHRATVNVVHDWNNFMVRCIDFCWNGWEEEKVADSLGKLARLIGRFCFVQYSSVKADLWCRMCLCGNNGLMHTIDLRSPLTIAVHQRIIYHVSFSQSVLVGSWIFFKFHRYLCDFMPDAGPSATRIFTLPYPTLPDAHYCDRDLETRGKGSTEHGITER
jgi:hypothetical protein